jgi:hypothetical protein
LKAVPALAMGGIAMGPTLALIGEVGPEAVVPLGRGGNGSTGSTVILNIAGSVRTERELLAFIQEGLLIVNKGNTTLGFT